MSEKTYLICFLAVSAGMLLLAVMDGARQGIGRKLTSILALLAGATAAYYTGEFTARLVLSWIPYPIFIVKYFGSVIAGTAVFLVIHLIGWVLFKKTAKHEGFERTRNLWGGALIGCLVGLFSVGIMMLVIIICSKFTGIVANNIPGIDAGAEVPPERLERHERAAATVRQFSNLDAAIQKIPGYAWIASIDPVPNKAYRVLENMIKVIVDDDKLERLTRQPQAKSILNNELIENLVNDQDIQLKFKQRDINALLTHPKIRAASQDPAVLELFRQYDWAAALETAAK